MARRLNLAAYILFGLLAVGIVTWFLHDPATNIIPVLVFGGVFLLYKFPPGRLRGIGRRMSVKQNEQPKRKPKTFRVIQGNKPDDDDYPRVH